MLLLAGHGSGACEVVSMLPSTRDRVAAATGALFVVLVMVGNQIDVGGTDHSAHPTGSSVLHDAAAQAHSTSATIGFTLEFLGFIAFVAFLGYLLDLRAGRASRAPAPAPAPSRRRPRPAPGSRC